jgi:hypothetical protein
MVPNLKGTGVLFGQFDVDVMLVRDEVVHVFKVLGKIARCRLAGHQHVHDLLPHRLTHPPIKKI